MNKSFVNSIGTVCKRCSFLVLSLSATPGYANQHVPVPSLEFLEYLGEWQDESGEFTDPLLLNEQELERELTESGDGLAGESR